jgi:hypothetical protein
VTTAPAATIAPRPIESPGRIIGTDRGSTLHRRPRKFLQSLLRARKRIVGEGDIGTNENIVGNLNSIPNLHTAFHSDSISHDNVILDEYIRTNIALRTNLRTRQHDTELPNPCPLTNILRLNV